jgi:Raf kinase inhibitor-like YbhB/YbcL family protein
MRVPALALLLVLTACGAGGGDEPDGVHATAVEPGGPRSITVTSPAFEDGAPIPSKYTCHGAGVSPPIWWSGLDLADIKDLALVVDDPDAPGGGYVHWVVVGVPTGHGAVDEGTVPDGARELAGTAGTGWDPPCPPSGTHHYRFTLYAFPSYRVSARSGTPTLEETLTDLAEDAVAWGRLTGTVTASGGDAGGGY